MIKDTINDLQRKYPYINSIHLNRNLIGNEISDFSLTLTLSNNQVIDENDKVTIKFWNIRELKLGEIDNLFRVYISISDISNRQMDGIRYRVSEEENNLFSFLCKDIEILSE